MKSALIFSYVKYINYIFDNLTKSQRHDRQIISPETEHRNPDQNTEDSRHCRSDQQSQEKAQAIRHGSIRQLGEKGAGESSHTHESRVSQTQLAQDSNCQIQEKPPGSYRHTEALKAP